MTALARPLLAICDDLVAALSEIDPETGELSPELADRLDLIEVDLTQKVEAYRVVRYRLAADAQACRELAASLKARADARERERSQLDERMRIALEQTGTIKTPTTTAYLQVSESVELTGDVPDEYVDVKIERRANKQRIKDVLKGGAALPFAKLIKTNSVRYR